MLANAGNNESDQHYSKDSSNGECLSGVFQRVRTDGIPITPQTGGLHLPSFFGMQWHVKAGSHPVARKTLTTTRCRSELPPRSEEKDERTAVCQAADNCGRVVLLTRVKAAATIGASGTLPGGADSISRFKLGTQVADVQDNCTVDNSEISYILDEYDKENQGIT